MDRPDTRQAAVERQAVHRVKSSLLRGHGVIRDSTGKHSEIGRTHYIALRNVKLANNAASREVANKVMGEARIGYAPSVH